MAEQPRRPSFRDGQTLAAADLELIVDSARNRAARSDRALSTPGIAVGCRLQQEDLAMSFNGRTVVTKRLTVTAGVAFDGNGRQLVFAADQPLPPEQFVDDVGTPEEDLTSAIPGASFPYPVLLTADEHDGPVPAFGSRDCGSEGAPPPVIEDVRIRIGRRGEHTTLATQKALGPGDDLADAPPWRVLLGFVRYHRELKRWVEVLDQFDGVKVRRVGARAGEVVSTADRLLLRVGEPAAPGQPALVLETADGGRLRFGRATADGGVDDVLSVTNGGAVTVRGSIDPGLVVGTVRVQSGIATDGMPLPLPPGVSAADVRDGKVVLHVQVVPRYPSGPDAFVVVRCDVDPQRVVHVALRRLSGSPLALSPVAAPTCDYLVAAAVVTPSGTSP
jgi:hypothetical protein